jgi:uncharacterized protein (DUF58 family)
MTDPLLPPELLRQLEQFQLLARRRAKTSLRGERRSRARGQSVEFADYRDYVAGDDFRYLDWNLYGRLDRLYLKLHEEERELPVTIFLDASESMTFGQPPKFDCARRVAAAIAYVALCGFDRVAIRCFPENPAEAAVRGALRSVRGKRSALPLFQDLGRLTAGGAATFNDSLRRCALQTRHEGLAVVLSDFLDPSGYEPGLTALLGRGVQVSAVQILAPEELQPGAYGDLRLIDSETGAVQEVSFAKHRLKAYQQSVEGFCTRLRKFCQKHGIHFFHTSSDASLEQLLLRQLRQAEIWG